MSMGSGHTPAHGLGDAAPEGAGQKLPAVST